MITKSLISAVFVGILAVSWASVGHAQPKPKPKAVPKPDLTVVVRLNEPIVISGRFKFDPKKSYVKLFESPKALKKFFSTKNCKPGKAGAKRCYIIDIKKREPEKKCIAVFLDAQREEISWKDFRIGQAETEDDAIRASFIGSGVYDDLYTIQRITYPLAPPFMIDEALYTKETEWLKYLLASACPK